MLAAERESWSSSRTKAFAELDQAQDIYVRTDNHRGIGAARINRGLLYFDTGEWDRAAAEATMAFELCEVKHDYIPMARARILQCMVENMRYDEEIGTGSELLPCPASPRFRPRRRRDRFEDAEPQAVGPGVRLAGAHSTNRFFNNPEAAPRVLQPGHKLAAFQRAPGTLGRSAGLQSPILRQARVDTYSRNGRKAE